jgi:hypothetical protein
MVGEQLAQDEEYAMKSSIYGALLGISPDLLAAVEQHKIGAAVVAGVAMYALSCSVVIAWLKYRRRR